MKWMHTVNYYLDGSTWCSAQILCESPVKTIYSFYFMWSSTARILSKCIYAWKNADRSHYRFLDFCGLVRVGIWDHDSNSVSVTRTNETIISYSKTYYRPAQRIQMNGRIRQIFLMNYWSRYYYYSVHRQIQRNLQMCDLYTHTDNLSPANT